MHRRGVAVVKTSYGIRDLSHVGMHKPAESDMHVELLLVRLHACVHRRPAVVGVAEVKTPYARIGVEYVIYAPAGNAEIRSVRTVLIGCVATYLGLACFLSERSSLLHR